VEATELIKRVRKIEIKTRGLSKNIFAGEYHTAFKGKGMAFSEDIRSIDWNVTARFNHPYVKIYEEERELTVMLLIDISGSRNFGSVSMLKKNIITEISAVLSFSAIHNNDKIGVILFSDRIEKFIPPKKGRQHILRIIRELIDFQPAAKETNISESLRFLTNAIKKRSIAFVISDFIDEDYDEALRIANRKHDVVALQIYDVRETELPPVGFIRVKDAETGKMLWIDTGSRKVRVDYSRWWEKEQRKLSSVLTRSGVDWVKIRTDEDYVRPLINLFKKR